MLFQCAAALVTFNQCELRAVQDDVCASAHARIGLASACTLVRGYLFTGIAGLPTFVTGSSRVVKNLSNMAIGR